jgi:release factor glutamine methyltransferase
MVGRRAGGEPLEQVLGWAEFHGLRVAVAPGVFVPRAHTAFLADQAAEVAPEAPVVLDLCCGSGALGMVLLELLDGVELHAADLEPAAVECARGNLGERGSVYEGDLYEPLPASLRGRIDVIVANAPYVPSEAIAMMPREARDHEPLNSLDGGPDGLTMLRRVLAGAPDWLAPGGHLLFETSESQSEPALGAAAEAGLEARVARRASPAAAVVIVRGSA